MKTLTFATAFAATLTAAFVGSAGPAAAAPTGGDAQNTISELEADGNRVIVNNLSGTPLAQATVVAVNSGADIRSTVPSNSEGNNQQVVTGKVYYVDVQ